jgi:GNAT superfamily N-acetyltransferase
MPPVLRLRRGGAPDHEGIRELAEAVYGVPRSPASIRWLYEDNPAGPAEIWLAEDSGTGQIVGCRPVFPWRMCIDGRVVLVRQAGDAMTHPGFRGRGVFSALVTHAWSELRDRGIPFGFSFSEPGSLSVYRKTSVGDGTGTREVLHFQRMVYPLAASPLLPRMPVVAAAAIDRAAGAVQRRRLRLPGDLSVFTVRRFGEAFDDLWARTADRDAVLTVRDSRYLNWRFLDGPAGPFQVLGLRRHGALIGYVAFEVDARRHGWIADLLGPPDPGTTTALLKAALAAMLERGCVKASIWAAVESRAYPWLRRLGFLPRERPWPMAVHVYRPGAEAEAALDPHRWWSWYGDRDVERLVAPPDETPVAARGAARRQAIP